VKKNDKVLSGDTVTVMFGRPPLETSLLQQMFYRCISDDVTASTKTDQDRDKFDFRQQPATKAKG
jgi:hypothetical protein